MRKNKIKGLNVPLYAGGGNFWGAVGGNLQNVAIGGVDSALSVVGASNVMDEYYSKDPNAQFTAKALDKGADVGGKIAPLAAGVVGTIYGGPQGGAMAMKGMQGVQSVGSQFDKQDSTNPLSEEDKANQAASGINQVGMQGVSMYGQASQMGAFRNGGMVQKYPDGGKMVLSNADVIKYVQSIYNDPNSEYQIRNSVNETDWNRINSLYQSRQGKTLAPKQKQRDNFNLLMPDNQGGYTDSGISPFDVITPSSPVSILKSMTNGVSKLFNRINPNHDEMIKYLRQAYESDPDFYHAINTFGKGVKPGSNVGYRPPVSGSANLPQTYRNGGMQQYPDGGVVNDNTGVNKYKKIYTEKELKEIQKRDALQKQKTSEFDKNMKLGNTVVAIPSNKGYDYPDSTYYYPNSKTGVGSPYITTTLGARLLGIGDANIQEKLKYSDVPYNIRQDSTEYNVNNFSQGGMMGNGVIHAPELGGGIVQYSQGGPINSEVEKQENTLNPDGSTTQFNGPSHEGGGIKTHLDPSTLIFSDRLKMNGKTFAMLNKINNTVKEDKILDDPKANGVKRLTAELMKMAKNRASETLFEAQESLKQEKMDKYAKRIGLSTNNKYPNGGMTPAEWNEMYKVKGWQIDPRQNTATGSGQYPAYYDPNTVKIINNPNSTSGWEVIGLAPDNSNYATYEKPVRKVNVSFGKDPTWIPMGQTTYNGQQAGYFRNSTDQDQNARYVYQGGQYVKMSMGGKYPDGGEFRDVPDVDRGMYMTDRSSFGNMGDDRMGAMSNNSMESGMDTSSIPWQNIAKQIGIGVAQNAGNIYDLKRAQNVENTKFERMTPTQLDPTAALNYNMVMGRKLNEDIRNSSGGNASNYIQNRKDAAIQQMMSNAQIRQNYANQNAGIMNQASMFNTNIGNQEIIANEQNRAQSRNLKSNAYANIGQNIMGQYRDNQMMNRDQDVANMIYNQYPENQYNPAYQNYRQKTTKYKK